MDYLMQLFVAVVLIASALTTIAVWAPRAVWIKVVALALAALLMPTAYAGLVQLLGKPKPAHMEWAGDTVPDATVLGVRLREGEAIYLWLEFDSVSEPRAYVLPWRLETAEQLQDALRKASANNTSVRMRQPFEASLDANAPLFYATPQPPLPTKTSLAN